MMIEIRVIERGDLNAVHGIRFHPEVSKWMTGFDLPRSESQQEEWYNQSEGRFFFVICKEEVVVGYVQVGNVDWQHRKAEVGFAVHPDHQGQKIGTMAVEWVKQFALVRLGLNRLYLHTVAHNECAIHVYEKCGFKQEGKKREDCWKDGEFMDVLVMGVLTRDL